MNDTEKSYTFTYPSVHGPAVERFESAELLLAFSAGWCCGSDPRKAPENVLVASRFDVRAG